MDPQRSPLPGGSGGGSSRDGRDGAPNQDAQAWLEILVRVPSRAQPRHFHKWVLTTFTGLTVLSNNLETPHLLDPPSFETGVMAADDPQLRTIVDGINRTRIAQQGEYFADLEAFFSVPELSSASPWLNLTFEQQWFGLTDEAYEILPSQLLSLIRADPVGTSTHSGDSIQLRFTAFDGYAYRVEGSADFTTWTTVSEPHDPTNGVFTLTLPASSGPQFFRAALLPGFVPRTR